MDEAIEMVLLKINCFHFRQFSCGINPIRIRSLIRSHIPECRVHSRETLANRIKTIP